MKRSDCRLGVILVSVALAGGLRAGDSATVLPAFERLSAAKAGGPLEVRYACPAPFFGVRTSPDGLSFTVLGVRDAGHGGELGRPDLPVLVDDIEVPRRGEVTVSATAGPYARAATPHWVYPLQPSVPKLPGALAAQPFVFDRAWYEAPAPTAAKAPTVGVSTQTYVKRGRRFVRVHVDAYAYDPARKELAWPETLTLAIGVAEARLPAAAGPRPGPVRIVEVSLADATALAALEARGLDIATVRPGEAVLYASDAEVAALVADGFRVTPIAVQVPGAADAKITAGYHSVADVEAMLTQFVADYPGLCRLETLGSSVQGRPILALRITDNPGLDEAEPEVKFVGAIHGDEPVGAEMCLRLAELLLTSHGTDSRLTALVDTTDLWLVPVMNPDGLTAVSRYNASGYDLNRSFPDGVEEAIGTVFSGPAMDLTGRPPEVQAMMQWSAAHGFVLSATFHGGALVANYPYDNDGMGSVPSPTPDDDVCLWLAETYASRNPPMWASPTFTHGVTNGAAWYVVVGGIQDWQYRYTGCIDLTLEISAVKRPASGTLDSFWDDNREAMLAYVESVQTGLRGVVNGADTGAPLYASVAVAGRSSRVFTDPDAGDYYRLLRPGTYSLTFTAPGYQPQTVPGVVVSEGAATVLDVTLERSTASAGVPLIVVHHADHDAAYGDFRALKNGEGYAVIEVRLTGTPAAETVRNAIRTEYDATGAEYLVLLGDTQWIPTYTNTAYASWGNTTAHSDLPYALMDPGETFDDYLGKDLHMGRISLDSGTEIQEYVNKLAAFNTAARHRDATWLTGGSDTWENNIAEGTHEFVIGNYMDPSYHNEKYYRANGTVTEFSGHINAGTDLVAYSGHGSELSWYRFGYSATHLAGLTNVLDAPVVFGHCCLTGSFELDDCFAEEWLETTARAVVYVGASDSTGWYEDDTFQRREFQCFWENPGAAVAEAVDFALQETVAAYPSMGEYYYMVYHVFGDPTVRLFPIPLELEHTPLADTANRTSPYPVTATVTAETGVDAVTLYWRNTPGAAFTAVPMSAAKSSTAYAAAIPAQPYGTRVEYYIQAESGASVVAHPAGAPGAWHTFRVDILFDHVPLANTSDATGPYAVAADVAADSAADVTLFWRAGEGAYTAVPMAPVKDGSYAAGIPGQPVGATVSYYLTAVVPGYSASEPSGAPAEVHTFLVDAAPPVFAGLALALAGDGSVLLEWSAAADASLPVTYSVFRASSSGGQNFASPLATTTGLDYLDTAVANGTTYHYVVRARDGLGTGEENTVERAATPVAPAAAYAWSLDSNPGWTTEGAWAFGQPSGGGGAYGHPDPTGGCTGPNVYGYNLFGDYTDNMPVRYLTTPAIDCTGLRDIELRFARWLNVEQPIYDHATVEVSADGTTWETVWQNQAEITDTSWVPMTMDISDVADGCPTLRIRWGMGPTDSGWTYSGWNIDDIEIWGVETAPPPAAEITVSGNGIQIEDGDTLPGATDGTDFGTTCLGTAVSRTFRVANTGTDALVLGAVNVPSGFTVTEPLGGSIPAGGYDDVTVRLDAGTAGARSGTLSFATNDADENPFDFAISGIVESCMAVTMWGNGLQIADGDSSPGPADGTDFGVTVPGAPVEHTFTVRNEGAVELFANPPTVPPGFTCPTAWIAVPMAPGESREFTIRLDAASAGTFSGPVVFEYGGATPFTFAIAGTVIEDTSTLTATRSLPARAGAGQTVDVSVALEYEGAYPVTSLAVYETLPPGWTFVELLSPGAPEIVPAPGAAGVLTFAWVVMPTFPCTLTYRVLVPADETPGTKAVGGTVAYRTNAGELTVAVGGDTGVEIIECVPHDADQNGSWSIEMSPELTRIIQFFNSGGYHCEEGTEDGYAPGLEAPRSAPRKAKDGVTATRDLPDCVPLGGTCRVDVTLDYGGAAALTSLAVTEVLPPGWVFQGVVGSVLPDLPPTPGATGTISFGWIFIPALPCTLSYEVSVPAASEVGCFDGSVAYRLDGPELNVPTGGDTCAEVGECCVPHGTDQNGDWMIQMSPELTRIIQFFNSGGYHCAEGTEDGYAPGPEPGKADAKEGTLTSQRSFGAAVYTAGGTLDVSVTLNHTTPASVTTLAVEETIPAGWTFVSVVSAEQPFFKPAVGASGTLLFGWLTMPTTWPVTLTYRLNVPADALGTRTFTGVVKFREDGGEIAVTTPQTSIDGNDATITFLAGSNGSLSGETVQTLPVGSDTTAVTAVPDTGYVFSRWVDETAATYSTDNPLVVQDVTEDRQFTAIFVRLVHITFAAGPHGSLTGATDQMIPAGSDATPVTAVPDATYVFSRWTSIGGATFSTQNPLTVTAVSVDLALTAEFVLKTYTLTYTAGAGGTITGTTPQTVEHGADGAAVTAVPGEGFRFVQWSDGVTTTTRQDTNVAADITVTAEFAILQYTLTYTAGANGTVAGATPQTVTYGADGTGVVAVPNPGYRFVQWSDGITTASRQDTNVTADITVTAEFAILQYTLIYTAGVNGTIDGVSPQTVDHGADGAAVTAVPDPGYGFVQWSDGVTTAARQDTNVAADITVTAEFTILRYTLTYTAGANGTIDGVSPQTVDHGADGTAV
ncbi:MAG: choice-of-anchor D domain-containing protein, partial [Lentisphaeria bacterium]|nr:choice-of-anchor D domain-containing protein [Lentisphaeria bacterium]